MLSYYFNIQLSVFKKEAKESSRKESGRVLGFLTLDSQDGTDQFSALKQRNP